MGILIHSYNTSECTFPHPTQTRAAVRVVWPAHTCLHALALPAAYQQPSTRREDAKVRKGSSKIPGR